MGETIWPGEYRRKVTRCKAMRVTTENSAAGRRLGAGGHTWASAVVVPIYSDGKRGEDTAPIGSWVVQVGGCSRIWPAEGVHRRMDGGDPMIAMPHLLFLTVLFVAGLVARRWTSPLPTSVILPGAVVAGSAPAFWARGHDPRRPHARMPLARPVRGHLRPRVGHVRAVPAHCVETPPDAPRRHPQRRSQPSPAGGPDGPDPQPAHHLRTDRGRTAGPLAMLLLTVAAAVTAVSDVRSHPDAPVPRRADPGTPMNRSDIYAAIDAERERQADKWGGRTTGAAATVPALPWTTRRRSWCWPRSAARSLAPCST